MIHDPLWCRPARRDVRTTRQCMSTGPEEYQRRLCSWGGVCMHLVCLQSFSALRKEKHLFFWICDKLKGGIFDIKMLNLDCFRWSLLPVEQHIFFTRLSPLTHSSPKCGYIRISSPLTHFRKTESYCLHFQQIVPKLRSVLQEGLLNTMVHVSLKSMGLHVNYLNRAGLFV